jgi:hypothetical protein
MRLILLNNPPFLETPSACLKTAQQISPTNGVQTILILGEGVLMVFLGVDLWPVGVLQQNRRLSYFQETLVRGCREPAASALLQQPRQMPSAAHVQARGDPGQGHGGLGAQLPG